MISDYRGNQEQVEEQLAGFADVSVRVVEGLRLNAGVRIAQTKFACDSENFSAFATDEGARLTGGRSKETPIKPKFSINYQVNPDLLVYASPLPGASILVEKGDGLPGISPWTFMIAGVQNFDVAGYDGYIRFAYEYSSRNLDTPVQNTATSQYDANLPVRPATRFVRVRAGVDVNQVNLSLFVDNRFDTSPRLTRAHNIRMTPLYTVTTFRPRTAGITATYRY